VTPIVAFYRGTGPDAAGRTIHQVWSMDDLHLEAVHDYIQWLFPTRKPSAFNADAPMLTNAAIAALRALPDFREWLLRSLDVMLGFYGLRRLEDEGAVRIEPTPDLATRGPAWWDSGNHNHLRLTRIISSLHELGSQDEAAALYGGLELVRREWATGISERTIAYWAAATKEG